MKNNVTISYLILTIIVLIWSCEEQEPFFSPYFLENYPKLLDNLNFYCPDQGSEKIISFDVLNQHNCYYDNIDDRFFIFAMHHTFTTPSPTITTGEKYDSKKLLGLTTHRKSYIYADNNILFYFPMVEEECDDENYLDSIFAINKFEIRSNINSKNSVLILMDIRADSTGNIFAISSEFGPQNDGYFKINLANKTFVDGHLCYELECEFECNLYHWPQYGKKGLFSKLSNGIIRGTYCIN